MSADAIVAAALPLEGLSYASDPNRYDAVEFPTDTDVAAKQMGARDYSCALTARAILRLARVDGRCLFNGRELDVLRAPYESLTGLAVSLLIQLASHHNLWRQAVEPGDLQPGVVLVVRDPIHVITITGRSQDDGVITLETIEGGQGPGGTAIARKSRQVVMQGGELVVGRAVYGCFDAGALPCLPQPDAALDPDATGPHDLLP